MMSFSDLLAQGTSHAWLFIPSAILLGILHGLEPGHSKTMMAAFIVAIRGTIGQAVLLGLTATISHTLIVWAIGLGGMYLWRGVDAAALEPYFQIASAAAIVAIAIWMFNRTRAERRAAALAASSHSHDDLGRDRRQIDTGHGVVALDIHQDGSAPRWRLATLQGQKWSANRVMVTTERPDGKRQRFAFVADGDYLESLDAIPEPHEFMVRVSLGHGNHRHDYDLSYMEPDHGGHDHIHEELRGFEAAGDTYQDAHQLAHANDIRRRFADREITNWQIALFGLTGGLVPCPAAITVLLLCLQLKQFSLGATLVLCFSIGLALTLVSVGVVAAISVRHIRSRTSWFSAVASRAPYFSSGLMIAVGIYVAMSGWMALKPA
jgi:nickel/cobalt exporter